MRRRRRPTKSTLGLLPLPADRPYCPPGPHGIPSMRHDRLRALLNAGEPSIGTHLLSPTLVELIGSAGIALTIAKREGVEDLDAVLSIKGIDMVQFGSSDYSMSLGLTGQRNHLLTGEARQ